MDTSTVEYIFASQFLHFIMKRRGVFWRSRDLLCRVHSNLFNTLIQDFVSQYLDKEERNIYILFLKMNRRFKVDNETFPMVAESLKNGIFNEVSTIAELIRYCIVLCQFSLLAYLKGSYLAPYTGLIATYDAIKIYISNKVESPDVFWATLNVHISELVHGIPKIIMDNPSRNLQKNGVSKQESRRQELKGENKIQNPQGKELQNKQAAKSSLLERQVMPHQQQSQLKGQDTTTEQVQKQKKNMTQQHQRDEEQKVSFQQAQRRPKEQYRWQREQNQLIQSHKPVMQELKKLLNQKEQHREQKRLPQGQEQKEQLQGKERFHWHKEKKVSFQQPIQRWPQEQYQSQREQNQLIQKHKPVVQELKQLHQQKEQLQWHRKQESQLQEQEQLMQGQKYMHQDKKL
ncbi:hypothetical protein NPIL_499371 [Nephila pilipes]|uniref:Uncharacterized protein n=1 Tax=Nephila pilipes TaxID=299642 RepID=A0A8X6QJI1_NEPPI|nr:hypothetical protein NPIL_499371 [Nephila pilipes]